MKVLYWGIENEEIKEDADWVITGGSKESIDKVIAILKTQERIQITIHPQLSIEGESFNLIGTGVQLKELVFLSGKRERYKDFSLSRFALRISNNNVKDRLLVQGVHDMGFALEGGTPLKKLEIRDTIITGISTRGEGIGVNEIYINNSAVFSLEGIVHKDYQANSTFLIEDSEVIDNTFTGQIFFKEIEINSCFLEGDWETGKVFQEPRVRWGEKLIIKNSVYYLTETSVSLNKGKFFPFPAYGGREIENFYKGHTLVLENNIFYNTPVVVRGEEVILKNNTIYLNGATRTGELAFNIEWVGYDERYDKQGTKKIYSYNNSAYGGAFQNSPVNSINVFNEDYTFTSELKGEVVSTFTEGVTLYELDAQNFNPIIKGNIFISTEKAISGTLSKGVIRGNNLKNSKGVENTTHKKLLPEKYNNLE